MRGEEIKNYLKENKGKNNKYKFDKIIPCNIGNPQAVGQKSIQFNRDVISGMLNEVVAESDLISKDAANYIRRMKAEMTSPMGAYTSNSKGHNYVRKTIADFIQNRDGPAVKADWNNVYLTNGASEGVR